MDEHGKRMDESPRKAVAGISTGGSAIVHARVARLIFGVQSSSFTIPPRHQEVTDYISSCVALMCCRRGKLLMNLSLLLSSLSQVKIVKDK